jgi:hypothetical protein
MTVRGRRAGSGGIQWRSHHLSHYFRPALVPHPSVAAEAAAVGAADATIRQAVVASAPLRQSVQSSEGAADELRQHFARENGPIGGCAGSWSSQAAEDALKQDRVPPAA